MEYGLTMSRDLEGYQTVDIKIYSFELFKNKINLVVINSNNQVENLKLFIDDLNNFKDFNESKKSYLTRLLKERNLDENFFNKHDENFVINILGVNRYLIELESAYKKLSIPILRNNKIDDIINPLL